MNRPPVHFSLATLCLLLAAGCGGDELITLGEVCSRISGPACDRAIACGLGPNNNRQECMSVFQDSCCKEDGTCGQKAKDKDADAALESYISACSAAFPTFDCASYAAPDVPSQCKALPATKALTLREPELFSPATPRASVLGRTIGRAARVSIH